MKITCLKGRRPVTKHTESTHICFILYPFPTLRIFMWASNCYLRCVIFKCTHLSNRIASNIFLAYDILLRSFQGSAIISNYTVPVNATDEINAFELNWQAVRYWNVKVVA
jgi:hypothetical protein